LQQSQTRLTIHTRTRARKYGVVSYGARSS
jgi:hypothetical protein